MADKPILVTIQANSVPALDPLIQQAGSEKKHLAIEKDGQRVVVMISAEEYDALMKEREANEQAKANRLKRFQQAARAMGEELERRGISEEEFLNTLDDSKKVVYQRYYGNTQE